MKADLHIHSHLSDGDYSVLELVSMIKDKNIELFSITDHDNVKSIEILRNINDIKYIPGVEMSSVMNNVKMHILGYGISDNGRIRTICEDIAKKRRDLALKILDDLRKRGYFFDEEYLERFNREDGIVLSKVDISKLLVASGYSKSVKEAFNGILKPYNVGSKIRQDAKNIISSIKEDDGISILAHPGEIRKKQNVDVKKVIDELCEIGIDGIEVFHPKHDNKEVFEFLKLAQDKDILITGGSDFHGNFNNSSITLGNGVNGDLISEKVKKKSIEH